MEHLISSQNALVRAIFRKLLDIPLQQGEKLAGSLELRDLLFKTEDGLLVYIKDCEDSLQALGVWDCLAVVAEYDRNVGTFETDLSGAYQVADRLGFIWAEFILEQSRAYDLTMDFSALDQGILGDILADVVEYVGDKSEKELFTELVKAFIE